MFKTIVVGTDGSDNAEKAVRTAVAMAGDGRQLHVVTAFRPVPDSEMRAMARDLPEEYRSSLRADYRADSIIDGARSIVRLGGVDAEFHEVSNDPTDALLSVVEQVDADLLVVGSRGENLGKRLMHGSVSTKLLHHSPCSVLIVQAD